MPDMTKLLAEYNITTDDIVNIKRSAPAIIEAKDKIADYHYDRLLTTQETARFFKNEHVLHKARKAFVDWVECLVSGDYSAGYYVKLNRIGATHVRIGLPAYQVNVQITKVRNYVAELVCKTFQDSPDEAMRIVASLNKILDLNLDLMTRSYREEELKVHFVSYKVDSWIIRIARWFVKGLNMILVVGLITTGIMVLALCISDIGHLTAGGSGVERGVLGALGSLLMLWVVIELLDTQIGHMKGHAFAIKVFVSVALVAELRKNLMITITHSGWREQAVLISSILVLGVVYWLISREERL